MTLPFLNKKIIMYKLKNLIVVKLAGIILFVLKICFGDEIFRKKLN